MKPSRYDKAIEVWWLLNKVEQLIVNDSDYNQITQPIANAMTVVENLQHQIEASGE